MEFKQAYDGLRQSFEKGIAMGDPDWVAALHAEDGVILAPGAEPVKGRDAIRAYEKEFLGAFQIELTIEVAEAVELGEKGWGSGAFKMKLTPRQGGAPVELSGKYLNVVQPREDGTLEILRHCWNADQPIPQP